MSNLQVPVLVAGGSLVGLSTGLLLGHHGIRALVVERHSGTAIHPRAAQITQRTMEVLRAVGIEAIVRQRSQEQFVQDGAIVAVETLAGKELGTFIANLNDGVRDVSPCERVFISQSLLEPQLKARAEALGTELRFGTELVSFEQDSRGVTATLRDRESDRTEEVRADYLVAADGPRSAVRETLEIRLHGRGVFSRSVTVYFRADVAPLLRERNLSVVYVNHPQLRGFFRFEKPFDRGFLAVMALGDPERPITDVTTNLTEARCLEWIHLALGAEIPVTIESVMPWNASAESAERYRDDRVFLAGDAAHVMPPNGGFGGNTGIQDAYDLAWKLALVLRGEAGEELLSTYDTERRPVGAFTTEQAYSRYVTRSAPYLGTDGIQPVAPDLHVELGYRYDSPAVCHEGGDPGAAHEDPRESKGRPGTRAPHVWLTRNGERLSSLDLFGRQFVFIAGPEASSWWHSAHVVAEHAGLPIAIHRLGQEGLEDPDGRFLDTYGLTARDALLVRPDGFVAWRSKTSSGSPSAIAAALAQITFRQSLALRLAALAQGRP